MRENTELPFHNESSGNFHESGRILDLKNDEFCIKQLMNSALNNDEFLRKTPPAAGTVCEILN